MSSQFKQIPIYISSTPLFIGKTTMHIPDTLYHFTSKKAKEQFPQAVHETYLMLQTYPVVIKEIKKEKVKKIIYSPNVRKEKANLLATHGEGYIGIKREKLPTEKLICNYATDVVHELRHMKQEREGTIPEKMHYEKDYEKYRNLPWEVDARKYTSKVIRC